jgi:hypothetical protein
LLTTSVKPNGGSSELPISLRLPLHAVVTARR